MSRKRDRAYISRHVPYTYPNPKRRRPHPPPPLQPEPEPEFPKPTSATVMVIGISPDCSVLDLKSRFEIYGPISRTRMDPDGLAYITFRSKDSADSAVDASVDPSFGISLHSQRVQVMLASDPVPQWRQAVGKKDGSSSSKLLRAEVPLSRHGRGNKLGSAIVDTRENKNSNGGSGLDMPFKGREIVAYDDIL